MRLNHFKDMMNFTWEDLEKSTGVSKSQLVDISKGKMPSAKVLVKIHNGTAGCVSFKDLAGKALKY
jgi:transcriptional regulator with XRE-family HTH domain